MNRILLLCLVVFINCGRHSLKESSSNTELGPSNDETAIVTNLEQDQRQKKSNRSEKICSFIEGKDNCIIPENDDKASLINTLGSLYNCWMEEVYFGRKKYKSFIVNDKAGNFAFSTIYFSIDSGWYSYLKIVDMDTTDFCKVFHFNDDKVKIPESISMFQSGGSSWISGLTINCEESIVREYIRIENSNLLLDSQDSLKTIVSLEAKVPIESILWNTQKGMISFSIHDTKQKKDIMFKRVIRGSAQHQSELK